MNERTNERSMILIIDDDSAFRDMIEDAIGEDYDVTLAVSGEHALEILKEIDAPDIILLDIEMPGMDGYETLNKILEIEGLPPTPVIFLTGIADSESESAGLTLGAQDYITKPFAWESLRARLSLRLEAGRQTRQLQAMRGLLDNSAASEERFVELTKSLTPAEREVARLIADGSANQEIAQKLHYSPGYVKNLATIIYDKLEVGGRVALRALLRKKM